MRDHLRRLVRLEAKDTTAPDAGAEAIRRSAELCRERIRELLGDDPDLGPMSEETRLFMEPIYAAFRK